MALDSKSTVLINGAAGGVGHLALQLAKWKGARVIAVAPGAHETFLRELGADEFIDYTKERPEEVVRDVDLVLDTVGGPDSRRFLRTLKRGGSLCPWTKLEETRFCRREPERAADQERERLKVPIRGMVRGQWRVLALCMGLVQIFNVTDCRLLSCMPSRLAGELHDDETLALVVLGVIVRPLAGALSDRVGRRSVTPLAARASSGTSPCCC
jgi:hypothetical protein